MNNEVQTILNNIEERIVKNEDISEDEYAEMDKTIEQNASSSQKEQFNALIEAHADSMR